MQHVKTAFTKILMLFIFFHTWPKILVELVELVELNLKLHNFPNKKFVRKIPLGSGSPVSYLSAVKTLLGISHLTSFLNSGFIGLGINVGRCDTCYSLQSFQMPLISSDHGSAKQKPLSFLPCTFFWQLWGILPPICSLHPPNPGACTAIPRLGATSGPTIPVPPIPAARLSRSLGRLPPSPGRALVNLYCSVCRRLTCN